MQASCARLTDRTLLRLSGADWRAFLQGLITNDVEHSRSGAWLYAGLLTPQGKYLYDFFLTLDGDDALLDIYEGHKDAMLRKLMMYRMRSKVEITPDETPLYAAWNTDDQAMADPRLPAMGTRAFAGEETANLEDYKAHRLALGIPDGPHDILQEKTLWLESNADLLHGVDFQKGCYVGQELTARMRYRGKVRRRLIPISSDSDIPAHTPIMLGERDIGETRSTHGKQGLANLRVEDLEKGPLLSGGIALKPWLPDWLLPTVEKAREPA